MQSILLVYCRKKYRFSFAQIADQLRMSVNDYKAVEKGQLFLRKDQARSLAKLYKINGTLFYCEALQNHYLENLNHVGKDIFKPNSVRSNLFLYLRRHFSGLSKKQVAEAVHISEELYEQIEQGRIDPEELLPIPALRRLIKLFNDTTSPLFMAENSQTQSLYQISRL